MTGTVVCFGDSNTYGYDPRSLPGDRYPKSVRWTGILDSSGSWSVTCCGQNGREIPTLPAHWEPLCRLLEQTQPDVLMVMLGSNDLLCHPRFTAGDVAARMEDFLKTLPPCHVLLVAPPPMAPGEWVREERLLSESAALAGEYESLALRLGIGFADAGQWGVELAFDGVHFSENGHRAFAKGIQEVLSCSLG